MLSFSLLSLSRATSYSTTFFIPFYRILSSFRIHHPIYTQYLTCSRHPTSRGLRSTILRDSFSPSYRHSARTSPDGPPPSSLAFPCLARWRASRAAGSSTSLDGFERCS